MALAREEFAKRLVELREEHDPPLTQKEAARLVGMSLRRYADLERSRADAQLATITKIASGFAIDPQRLLVDEPPSGNPPAQDIARLEWKVNLLLEHHGILTDELADMELPPALRTPDESAPPAKPSRRRKPKP